MAITESVGYGGTVGYDTYSQTVTQAGRYTVEGPAAWKVSVASGDRTVRVAAGVGAGYGIRDTATATDLQHSAVSSGVRHDLVVCRRDWSSESSEFVIIEGGTPASLPPRSTGPGVLDDQPLALVRISAGSTVPVVVADLRCWAGDGGVVAVDDLALDYLGELPGTRVSVLDRTYTRALSAGGAPYWVTEPLPTLASGWASGTNGFLATVPGFTPSLRMDGKARRMALYLRNSTGGTVTFNSSTGSTTDRVIAQITDSAHYPDTMTLIDIMYRDGSGTANFAAQGYIATNGDIYITSGAPGTSITPSRPVADGWSVFIYAVYYAA